MGNLKNLNYSVFTINLIGQSFSVTIAKEWLLVIITKYIMVSFNEQHHIKYAQTIHYFTNGVQFFATFNIGLLINYFSLSIKMMMVYPLLSCQHLSLYPHHHLTNFI